MTTVQEDSLLFSVDNGVRLNGASVTIADLGGNGVVYVIHGFDMAPQFPSSNWASNRPDRAK